MRFSKSLLRIAFLGSLLTALFVVSAAAANSNNIGVGTVTAEALRLRSEAHADGSILATASKDELVMVLDEADEGWYKVDYRSIEGYMSAEFLEVATSVELDLGYGRVKNNCPSLNVRTGPGTEYELMACLSQGKVVSLLGFEDGWYKIACKGSTGYVSSSYIITCLDETGIRGDGQAALTLGEEMTDYAKQFLGVPYVWGGNGPNSFDCSGFTKYVYSHFGYELNRTASAQMSNGVSVSRGELRPGDLVFFNNGRVSTSASHVGMYIGGGQFIHASTNRYCVEISSLSGYYQNIYIGARRVIN